MTPDPAIGHGEKKLHSRAGELVAGGRTGKTARLPVSPCPVIRWGKPYDRPENRLPMRLLGLANLAFARLYHQVRVLAPPCLPTRGAAILVSNHTSGLDPLLLQSCCERAIIWMMAKEYYDLKPIRWVFRTVEAIPVERSGRDMAATRAALRALKDGRILGIFPEGKIEPSHEVLPFQTGVALMALKARVPVYPVYLDGTQRNKEMIPALAIPRRASVKFGPAVEFDRSDASREGLEVATEKIRNSVKYLQKSR